MGRFIATLLLSILACLPVGAHSFYPLECCHDQDCAPVERVDMATIPTADAFALPQLVVTTKHGSAIVPATLPRRLSPDGLMHACIRSGRVICIFMPGGS